MANIETSMSMIKGIYDSISSFIFTFGRENLQGVCLIVLGLLIMARQIFYSSFYEHSKGHSLATAQIAITIYSLRTELSRQHAWTLQETL